MTEVLAIIGGVAGLALYIARGILNDEIRGRLRTHAKAGVDDAIASLPADLRTRWRTVWQEDFRQIASLPLTAFRFEAGLRRLPRTLVEAEATVERAIASLPPDLQDEWGEEWRAELAVLARDPIKAGRFARGVRVSARSLGGRRRLNLVPLSRGARPYPPSAKTRTRDRSFSRVGLSSIVILAGVAVLSYAEADINGVAYLGQPGLTQYLLDGLFPIVVLLVLLPARRYLLVATRPIMLFAAAVSLAVLVPGIGVDADGARRWLMLGPIFINSSGLVEAAVILFAARYLADNPRRLRAGFKPALAPLLVAVGPLMLLVAVEPDLGTVLVLLLVVAVMLFCAGLPAGYLLRLGLIVSSAVALMVLVHPYELTRLTSFLHPSGTPYGASYELLAGQHMLSIGGLTGVGFTHAAAAVRNLPMPTTTSALGVVAAQFGLVGVGALMAVYSAMTVTGLKIARRATTRYEQLLATGITSAFALQAALNFLVFMGLLPMTEFPLPFASTGASDVLSQMAGLAVLVSIGGHTRREAREKLNQTTTGLALAS